MVQVQNSIYNKLDMKYKYPVRGTKRARAADLMAFLLNVAPPVVMAQDGFNSQAKNPPTHPPLFLPLGQAGTFQGPIRDFQEAEAEGEGRGDMWSGCGGDEETTISTFNSFPLCMPF